MFDNFNGAVQGPQAQQEGQPDLTLDQGADTNLPNPYDSNGDGCDLGRQDTSSGTTMSIIATNQNGGSMGDFVKFSDFSRGEHDSVAPLAGCVVLGTPSFKILGSVPDLMVALGNNDNSQKGVPSVYPAAKSFALPPAAVGSSVATPDADTFGIALNAGDITSFAGFIIRMVKTTDAPASVSVTRTVGGIGKTDQVLLEEGVSVGSFYLMAHHSVMRYETALDSVGAFSTQATVSSVAGMLYKREASSGVEASTQPITIFQGATGNNAKGQAVLVTTNCRLEAIPVVIGSANYSELMYAIGRGGNHDLANTYNVG